MLTPDEKRELLGIARESIASTLRQKPYSPSFSPEGNLSRHCGAFVTIRLHHDLRGCIGYIESAQPLAEVVAEVAAKAAIEDPRFPAMTIAELGKATLDVSVLSPIQPVKDIQEIEVGKHGLLLELGMRRGLLLPQVAVEYRWTREEFLENTARKAGLFREAWKDPRAKIYMFSAEVVEEEEHAENL